MYLTTTAVDRSQDLETALTDAHNHSTTMPRLFIRKDGRRYPVRMLTTTLTNEDTPGAELELEFTVETTL